MDTIADRIKSLRLSRGLSGAELARRIGIKQPSLWGIETGDTKTISGAVLAGLCRELHTTPEWVMFGAGNDDMLELEMQAAEVLFAFRHIDQAGRAAMLATARGLMQGASPSVGNPYPTQHKAKR